VETAWARAVLGSLLTGDAERTRASTAARSGCVGFTATKQPEIADAMQPVPLTVASIGCPLATRRVVV